MTASKVGRRGWMGAAAAGALALGGGLVIVARQRREQATLGEAEQAFWTQRFDPVVDGEPVRVDGLRGRPLLLNFWATWCPPCVAELPLLDAFYQAQRSRGWSVLGLAVDQRGAVVRFLQSQPLSFTLAMAGYPGIELSRSLGNVSGALPFSAVFASDGTIVHRKIGKWAEADLNALARTVTGW